MAEAPSTDLYEDLEVVAIPGGSVKAVHRRTGWTSPPLPNEKAARNVFARYVEENAEEIAEAPDEPTPVDPLQDVSDEDLLAAVAARGLTVVSEEPDDLDFEEASVSKLIGWTKGDDGEIDPGRAKVVLAFERDRVKGTKDKARSTLTGPLEAAIEAAESPPDDGNDE